MCEPRKGSHEISKTISGAQGFETPEGSSVVSAEGQGHDTPGGVFTRSAHKEDNPVTREILSVPRGGVRQNGAPGTNKLQGVRLLAFADARPQRRADALEVG